MFSFKFSKKPTFLTPWYAQNQHFLPLHMHKANVSYPLICTKPTFLAPWYAQNQHFLPLHMHKTDISCPLICTKPTFLTPWYAQNQHLLPLDIHTYLCVVMGKKCCSFLENVADIVNGWYPSVAIFFPIDFRSGESGFGSVGINEVSWHRISWM